ncbi:bacteriophage regulatory protein [Obesumbacterium proteus]|uniref:phage late control D family protein n=1 Tax=Obesumbacterium proteus TaxID=82983 RepID=UPI0006229BF3|nr:contractile injection system protein, VgrG/Pvc8 family [Obesumbacterium proteus]KKI46742.1 bacteriophage regulatory protein [Obesumbacterium proteus]
MVAIAATSDVSQPTFTLWYEQKDITHDIAPFVTNISYSNNINSESDEIEVQLDDSDGRWCRQWYPGKGDKLTLKLGYTNQSLLDCGTFSIDEIELASPPSTVSIRGVATSVNNALRTKTSRGFEDTTLTAIASRVAQKHGLKLVGKIEPVSLDRVTQYAETDVGFLKRIASDYGYAVKVTMDQLIFSHLDTLRSQAALLKLSPTDVTTYSLRDTINQIYKQARVKHQNSKEKKLVVSEVNSGGTTIRGKATSEDTLKVEVRAPNDGTAQLKANAALDNHNEQQKSGSVALQGSPQLTAGNKIELVNFGELSGCWLIEVARHRFDRSSGYVTEIDITSGPRTDNGSEERK